MKHYKYCLLLLLSVWALFASCQSTGQITQPDDFEPDQPVDYSVVIVIHGDSDYLFHQNGNAYRADEEVLKDAISVAEETKSGEFFIFHQKPKRKILWLFSRENRQLYHYRNGKLVNRERYKVDEAVAPFEAEGNLYQQYAANSEKMDSRFFFYFGHEIPLREKSDYHRSYPSIKFSQITFSEGIDQFTTDALPRFNLIALSTCNNGSPDMVTQLSTKTDYLLASPHNLHLSHFDLAPLTQLDDAHARSGDIIGREIAEKTYQRLSDSTRTSVTISLYSMYKLDNYLNSMYAGYQEYLRGMEQFASENMDCRSVDELELPGLSAGVEKWYRAPQFGPNSGVDSHSGWGCKY